jgi:hypothetical protein
LNIEGVEAIEKIIEMVFSKAASTTENSLPKP